MDTHHQSFHDQAALLRFAILSAQTENTAAIYEYLTIVVVADTYPTKHWLCERILERFQDEQFVPEAVEILAPIQLRAKDPRAITAAKAWVAEAIIQAPSFAVVYQICALFAKQNQLPKYIKAAAHCCWEKRPNARPELLVFITDIKKGRDNRRLYLSDWLTKQATSTDPTVVVWQALFEARAGNGDRNGAIAQAYIALAQTRKQLH